MEGERGGVADGEIWGARGFVGVKSWGRLWRVEEVEGELRDEVLKFFGEHRLGGV